MAFCGRLPRAPSLFVYYRFFHKYFSWLRLGGARSDYHTWGGGGDYQYIHTHMGQIHYTYMYIQARYNSCLDFYRIILPHTHIKGGCNCNACLSTSRITRRVSHSCRISSPV
jgi:hypothetical protein